MQNSILIISTALNIPEFKYILQNYKFLAKIITLNLSKTLLYIEKTIAHIFSRYCNKFYLLHYRNNNFLMATKAFTSSDSLTASINQISS